MADAALNADPFFFVKPHIVVGTAGSGFVLECGATHATLEPDQDEKTIETFCGVHTSYGAEKWLLTVTVAMSYGSAGIWQLRPLVNTVVPWSITPAQGAVSVGNPEASGTGFLKGFAFIDAAPGEGTETDIVIGVNGIPSFVTV